MALLFLKFSSVVLLLLLLFTATQALRCYACKGKACARNNVPLITCPKEKNACFTHQIDRYSVERGCHDDNESGKDEADFDCSHEAQTKMSCQVCYKDGCNMDYQEPLTCRTCDWTFDEFCEHRVRCHIPFGTHYTQCYQVYHRTRGFHYGCVWESPPEVESLIAGDEHNLIHRLCDGHDCNARLTFLDARQMFEPYRFCDQCSPEFSRCGMVNCRKPMTRYGMFCYKDENTGTAGCLSDLTKQQLTDLHDGGTLLICSQSFCNENLKAKLACTYRQNQLRHCPLQQDRCVAFILQNGKHNPTGCLSTNPCYDRRRCFICDTNYCNDQAITFDYSYCYYCEGSGPHCTTIRQNQMMHIRFCGFDKECMVSHNKTAMIRACGKTPPPEGLGYRKAIKCKGHYCNWRPTTALCYRCSANNRDCVFSQKDFNFYTCPPLVDACHTVNLGDGRVERGCGPRKEPHAVVCGNRSLCNVASTVNHACHMFETDFDLNIDVEPPVQNPQFRMGWTPDTCTDVDGKPACYMSYEMNGLVWGCLSDRRNYREYFYGAKSSEKYIECEGHYCNLLP